MSKKKHKRKAKASKKQLARVYDAGQSSNYHKAIRAGGNSPDAVNHTALVKLRGWSRYLAENHDLAIGVLDNLVNRIVGPGLTIEPTMKRANGNLDERTNDQLRELWADFWARPDVTGELTGPELEALACRALFRDGEILTHHVMGTGSAQHNSAIPYSLEMLEADYLPMDLVKDNVTHGVEKDAWGRPTQYHLYTQHPGDNLVASSFTMTKDTRAVSADVITHCKFVQRFRQTRGVPILHGVIRRLDDIKDYSESERIKARVNAAFTSYIKRSIDYTGDVETDANREMQMQSGIIFDGLAPGEEIASVGTDTPNPNLGPFIAEMMRAVASGTNTSYSSISRHYDGTYSAQRQELVEAKAGYDRLSGLFIGNQILPVWRRFIDITLASGLLRMPRARGKTPAMMLQALYKSVDIRGPGMPWIDPAKETQADRESVEAGFESRQGVIRKRGGDPRLIDKELEADRKAAQERMEQQQEQLAEQSTDDERPPTEGEVVDDDEANAA